MRETQGEPVMNCSEQYRHECECRYWIEKTGGDMQAVRNRIDSIRQKRGQTAANRLLDGMRVAWKSRGEK